MNIYALKSYFIKSLLITFSFILVSCGGRPQVIQDLSVSTTIVDGDAIASIDTELNFGNLMFPAITLPIIVPHGVGEIGSLELNPISLGVNHLSLNVNLSEATRLDLARVELPNGSQVPLIGQEDGIVIPVGNGKKIKIYLSLGEDKLVVGVAIPFKTLDSVGRRVGTTSLFPVFNVEGVFGAAGMFTSKSAGKNGFGLFLDLSSEMAKIQNQIAAGTMQKIDYNSQIPSSKKEERINKEVYKLHKAKKRLKLLR